MRSVGAHRIGHATKRKRTSYRYFDGRIFYDGEALRLPLVSQSAASGATSGAAGGEATRPTITMPGAAPSKPAMFGDADDARPPSADVSYNFTKYYTWLSEAPKLYNY